jgi:hypothetical protein
MYKPHPNFLTPSNKDVKIWRYMDITKFLSLLEKRSLYFSRADCLGDPFEGSIPSTEGQINLTELAKKNAESTGIVFEKIIPILDTIRKCSYVCSFHINDHESAALWSIYAKARQGVAIQSTFSRFCDCFNEYSDNPVRIGMVNYIDYTTETIPIFENAFLPLLHKRKSFEYERELRAAISFPKELYPEPHVTPPNEFINTLRGLDIPVDLNILIERIYVAPTTEKWIKELLVAITRKYGLDKSIEQSSLDARPII